MKKLKLLFLIGILIIVGVFVTHHWISFKTLDKVYNDINAIPEHKVGLLLGVGKYTANGNINLYYKYRLEAAVELFKAGKIKFILVSGDNSRKGYDEPTTFKKDLINKGIPEHCIYLDYAGFRTLDSVIRSKEIFGQTHLTVISQRFHNERAIYIANHYDIHAIGFNAKDVYKTPLREYLARAKASLDLFFNVKPKFLGKKIIIP